MTGTPIYIRVDAGAIVAGPMRLPAAWTRPNGQRVRDYAAGPAEMHHADGWREIGPRPETAWHQTADVVIGDDGNPTWRVSDIDIDAARDIRGGEVQAAMDAYMAEGCPVALGDMRFRVDCMSHNVADWTGVAAGLLADPDADMQVVIDYDNQTRFLTRAQVLEMCRQVKAHVEQARFWARGKKDALLAAETMEALLAVEIGRPG